MEHERQVEASVIEEGVGFYLDELVQIRLQQCVSSELHT